MFKIEAIVREDSLEDVKAALLAQDIRGITVSQVMGCGTQMGYTQLVRGSKVSTTMLPKIKFEIVVSTSDWAEKAIEAIRSEPTPATPATERYSYTASTGPFASEPARRTSRPSRPPDRNGLPRTRI